MSLRKPAASPGSANTASTSASWSFGVRSRIPLQPISPNGTSTAAVEVGICRVMVSVSLLERYGRADIENALLRVVLPLGVPRLGVHHTELVPGQEIESIGVHPHVV